jgi:hypothetical protein
VRVGSTLIGERVLGWEKESDSFSAIRALIFLHFSKENKRKEAKEKKEMVTSNAGGVVLIFRKIHHFRKTHVRVQ